MFMHNLLTQELSCGHSSTLSQPTGIGGGRGISGRGLGGGSVGRVVGSSAIAGGSSEDGPTTGLTGSSGCDRGESVIGERVVIFSVEVA